MIRLIASDMDGTILKNGAQTLPPRILPIIERLREKGIGFVAASGRQYGNLKRLMGPAADSVDYICENGAFAVHSGKIIYKATMERDLGQELMRDIWSRDGCEIQLSGVRTAYIQAKDPSYTWHLKNVLKNDVTEVRDIFKTEEDYIKISAYVHGDKTEERLREFKERWKGVFTLASTCDHWIDFIPDGINKGHAMRALMETVNISREQIMAFGDNYNDLELLACAEESYAVSDGKPEVIAACRHICDSVEDVLETLLH
ncbi:HAD family hydrolase [Lacrimispora sp. NSJ-141]|uniref:HAD family hydrolase n=1 Tax=Lientehia hominis TaxID=2897778 RepID=A0AAP2RJY6_9FIRM|nr:HAD family hydrolase [Lientehia hominis]MCD2492798.1 HAD family hydrolase [Lientehia hominis]